MNNIKQLASLESVKFPHVDGTDKVKTKAIRLAINSAMQSGSKHLANSLHHVRSKRSGFERIDRIGALTNAIDKFSRLNPKVLKGGDHLKSAILAVAWQAYAVLEVDGTDNAHFTETQIPCQVDGYTVDDDSTQGFNNPDFVWAHHAAGLSQ